MGERLTKAHVRRVAIASAACLYIGIGAALGGTLYRVMPAVNLLGATYYAATWPLQLKWSPVHPPIASWMFTFPGREALKGHP